MEHVERFLKQLLIIAIAILIFTLIYFLFTRLPKYIT